MLVKGMLITKNAMLSFRTTKNRKTKKAVELVRLKLLSHCSPGTYYHNMECR